MRYIVNMRTKLLCQLIVIVCMCSIATAWFRQTDISINPAYPGKCWTNETNSEYLPGEAFTLPLRCVKYTCTEELKFNLQGCERVYASDGHHLESDLSKDYPDCCPIAVPN